MRKLLDTVSFEIWTARAPLPDAPVPAGLAFEFLVPPVDPSARELVVRAGAGDDVRYFAKGATACVARLDGTPVGVGWQFPHSRLLRMLGYGSDAVYLGGFFVQPSARGRGIYPATLRYISRCGQNHERLLVLQISAANMASRRGAETAGFSRTARVRALRICGVTVLCRGRSPERLP